MNTKRNKCVTDRSLLRFADEAKSCFFFLEEHGFDCVCSEGTFVRFESKELAINIFHGRQSYEIGLELESPLLTTDRFSFSELLRLVDQVRAEHYRTFAANTAKGVSDGVRHLAESFHQCFATGILELAQTE